MLNKKTIAATVILGIFAVNISLGASLEENWNDFLHYTKIGRLALAKDYARVVLASNPDPVELLSFSEENPEGYAFLLKASETPHDAELAELSGEILGIIEEGRFIRRADPEIIIVEIKRLSSTARARLDALRRLQNAGEYAIPYIIDALADSSRREEWPNIIWALSKIGRGAIRPLVAALQTQNVAVKAEIIKALGAIGYPQSLAYLKYVVEKEASDELRDLAKQSIRQIDPVSLNVTDAQLFYQLAERYYYHTESLAPADDVVFANIWFWDSDADRLIREKVDKCYFNELMAMRACEWALKADEEFGQAIGLWIAGFFKAESYNVEMPNYFGAGHADPITYATTAGPEYLHQALARAIRDENAYVALGVIEALAVTAGEKSLLYRLGPAQPLTQALSFGDRAVKYSAAIAIAEAGPTEAFPESKLVIENLAQAIGQTAEQIQEGTGVWNEQLANSYAIRSAKAMLKLGQTKNPVIDLSAAQGTLIKATKDKRPEIQILACQILAHIDSPSAQRSISEMALDQANAMNIRISAFGSLAVSAKLNANLLDGETIDTIYSLVSSLQTEPELRAAAAAAYGALNLPSQKVKNLILDQTRS